MRPNMVTAGCAGRSNRRAWLENRGVPEFPIDTTLVERLQPPVFQRPVAPQRWIALVDFSDQLDHRLPAQFPGDLAPHVQVDTRDKKISAGLHKPPEITQTPLCLRWL